jgi:hydrogenase nickel incorporation protein HypA/HybF
VHEVSVVSEIVNAVFRELSNYKVSRVDEITLLIGDMTNLGKDQLAFAFEIVTRDTILEGAELKIVPEAIEVECMQCNYRGPVDTIEDEDYVSHSIPILACPMCKGPIKVVAGQSCRVTSMRFEEDD